MRWLLRLLGLGVAVGMTMAVVAALPVCSTLGVAPIHGTRIDTAMMAIGFFLMFWTPIALVVEHYTMSVPSLLARADARIPRARIVR